MTDGMRSGFGSQQQFLVEQEGRIYVTQVVQELNPQDEQYQSMLRDAVGRAVSYEGGGQPMEVKAASSAQIDNTFSGAQIDNNIT